MSGRLLIVEDDPRLGPIMRDVLASTWTVQLCSSAEEGLDAVLTRGFDAVVTDRRLPGMSGEDLVRELRRRRIGMPILMLTALGELHDRVEGLDAGANDYLVKPFEFEELSARLRALTRDYTAPAAGIAIGGWTFHPDDHSIDSPYAGRILLTEAESAFLAVLAAQPERTFSREYLLEAVFARGESPTTVETYVHYIRRKTDRDLIQTVRGAGYRLGTPA
ncbi:DNA-binding response regulator, OmpR family, contains REC and winged-helix (wHTH) domain [Microbacterium azadirachtae]|uniref:DNA-binding response regulator, OmpR family, contains REC and winged-helix (WHTH) domain n=1 Tax=Microbacterium azadirachtae TaxID=582680 RepID=A0A1I6HDW7_9MICO|nr:response regulator transcription factor [Microbacterium azadirachtae]SFR52682.1 DNA-binding response regulator, OmpR family, contains REC and winged-helix (wHTH) domain [Microbacterium azadirachtae]